MVVNFFLSPLPPSLPPSLQVSGTYQISWSLQSGEDTPVLLYRDGRKMEAMAGAEHNSDSAYEKHKKTGVETRSYAGRNLVSHQLYQYQPPPITNHHHSTVHHLYQITTTSPPPAPSPLV